MGLLKDKGPHLHHGGKIPGHDGGTKSSILEGPFDQNRVYGLTVYGPCCSISPSIIDPRLYVDWAG